MSQPQEKKFESWCIVELFGHAKIAGKCTEQNIAGTNMLRVDVPETKNQPAFTRFFGSAAIYAINPVDETTATIAAQSLEVAPISVWQGDTFTKKFLESKPAIPERVTAHDNDEEDDFDNDSF